MMLMRFHEFSMRNETRRDERRAFIFPAESRKGNDVMNIKIRLLASVLIDGEHACEGDIVEVNPLLARQLVGSGRAAPAPNEAPAMPAAPATEGKQTRAPGLNTTNSPALTRR